MFWCYVLQGQSKQGTCVLVLWSNGKRQSEPDTRASCQGEWTAGAEAKVLYGKAQHAQKLMLKLAIHLSDTIHSALSM